MPEVVEYDGAILKHDAPAQSLRDKISMSDMGTRLVRDTFQLPSQTASIAPSGDFAAYDDLLSFVFKYFSDLPDETIAAAAESVNTIMHDDTLNSETRKSEIEGVFGEKLTSSEFNDLNAITQKLTGASSGSDQKDAPIDLLEGLSDQDDEPEDPEPQDLDNTFVPIDDPIRVHDHPRLKPQTIDASWLEYQLRDRELQTSVDSVLEILEASNDVESALLTLFGAHNASLVELLSRNASIVLWYTRLNRAETGPERELIVQEINKRDLSVERLAELDMEAKMLTDTPQTVDLAVIGRPVEVNAATPNVKLPEGSTRFTTASYEQYNVPAVTVAKPNWPLKPVKDLPEWAQAAFPNITNLNPIQSRSSEPVLQTDDNVLLCAPTGAGKTNVALLALTKSLHNGQRAVYIAPLKALVQEQVRTFQSRLPNFIVAELSGDQSLTGSELATTDVLVATPEKWDIVRRNPANWSLVRSIGLVVIDEIHLLHDQHRGSVLENIVAHHNWSEVKPRLLGLSATLPNYRDVAEFLQVPDNGILFFDVKFRPVPLEQKYVGITAKSSFKFRQELNNACAEKVSESLSQGKQTLVFVHSRKETASTAQMLEDHEITHNLISKEELGVHHAGLNRAERALAESRFLDGNIKVLICTATLAWGVNLPASVVIIKGTQFYDPSYEGWRQLQPQDVLQMLGRAGRPGFDSAGLGIILTEHRYLSYFASIANMSLPIQSHLIARIGESLNAEISLGKVRSIDEAETWLHYTFWYVRSTKDPRAYGIHGTSSKDIAHSALRELENLNAIVYDFPEVRSTFQGRIAATFYISPSSVMTYSKQLKPWLNEVDIIRIVALSSEFSSIPVRREEKAEVERLSHLVPIPIIDEKSSRVAKVSVLLQAYIAKLTLSGLAISADMVYIAQSASRLIRAVFQLSIAHGWSRLAHCSLQLYLSVDRRMWYAGQTPFRQFPDCPQELITRSEALQLPWNRYFDLDSADVGNALRLPSQELSDLAVNFLSWFPRFSLAAKARPITRTILELGIEIKPLFVFNEAIHNASERFFLLVENQRGTMLDWRMLKLSDLLKPTSRQPLVFLQTDSFPPFLFVRLLSDRWLHADYAASVSLRKLLAPAKFSMPLSVADSDLEQMQGRLPALEARYHIGPLQKSLLPLLYGTSRSTYVGLSAGTRRDIFKEMVILRAKASSGRSLLITPKCPDLVVEDLIAAGASQYSVSTELSDGADVVVIGPVEAENLTRGVGRAQKFLSSFELIVFDDLDRIGRCGTERARSEAALYELAVTRAVQSNKAARIVAFGFTLATARAVGQWIGAQKSDVANISYAGPEMPMIEVRHYDGSIPLGLRSVDLSSGSVLFLVPGVKQARLVVNELSVLGYDDVLVLTKGWVPGAIQKHIGQDLIVATTKAAIATPATLRADRVVLFGAGESGYDEGNDEVVPLVDVLELASRASKEFTVFTDRQQYFATFLTEPLPLESTLTPAVADALAVEIAKGQVTNPQDAVDWLSTTYLYRRLRQNPSYYGSESLEDYISELVESSFEELARAGAVTLNEDDLAVSPLPLAHIVGHYGVLVNDVTDSRYRPNIGSWVSNATQNVLSLRALDARIDFAVSQGNLRALFSAIDARQSLVQSVPTSASPLLQIPYIDETAVVRCNDAGVTTVQDFVAVEDDDLRNAILGFDNEDPRMLEVANFVNHFPIVDITNASVAKDVATVVVERDIEEDDEVAVVARGIPSQVASQELWFVVVGDLHSNTILGFKRLEIRHPETLVELELSPSVPGTSALPSTVWLMCSSYIDADKEFEIVN